MPRAISSDAGQRLWRMAFRPTTPILGVSVRGLGIKTAADGGTPARLSHCLRAGGARFG